MDRRLDDACRFLKGVGPRRAAALERLDVRDVEDLLLHLPRTYFDRRSLQRIADLQAETHACIRVRVEALVARRAWRGRTSLRARVADATGVLDAIWYNTWGRGLVQPGDDLLLAGPVSGKPGRIEMRQPEFERIEAETQDFLHGARIVPLYPLTRGVSQKWLRQAVHQALEAYAASIVEVLPGDLTAGMPARAEAFRDVHFPGDLAAAERARNRFVFEELFFFQLLLARRREATRRHVPGIVLSRGRGLQERYLAQLPFRLTRAQERVIGEIGDDLASGRWMQRLVQGDVGSGKTAVAFAALFRALENGYQGVLMVPTEALAIQHAERLVGVCVDLGVRFGLLVGSRSEREKEELRARMASGDVDLVVGTHALIQDGVRWARLGLAVVDEQHRFGVLQRGALRRGDENGPRAHVLVMSATPIPRSLALTVFGDLDVSRLDEKPPGRQPVQTRLVPPGRRGAMLEFVRAQVGTGAQAYVVLPLVEESDKIELRDATAEFERLRSGAFAGLRVGLLHGRLPSSEKESLLHDFQRGRLQVLVSTTVVEVGLDVARASLMIVHHPERFGLSQLHQLRGRVGRGSTASWCFLLAEGGEGEPAHQRLTEFASTEDGFRIAELDLRLRGPGDFVGTRQHGLPTLRNADLIRDVTCLDRARAAAFDLVRRDPELVRPENAPVRLHLESRYGVRQALAEIG